MAIFSHDWLQASLRYKRMVLLSLLRARQPCALNFKGVSYLNFVTLTQVRF